MRVTLEDVIAAAKAGSRLDPPSSSDYVTFYYANESKFDEESFKALLELARNESGVNLEIVGGGAGCLRIICNPDDAEAMKQLITSTGFRERARKAGVDSFWVDGPHASIPTACAENDNPERAMFGILTPLTEEFRSLRACLRDQGGVEKVTHIGVATYYTYRIESEFGHQYDVVTTFMSRMGNDCAAIATLRLIHDWNPRYLLLTGIAAALDDDYSLGDVVIADQVMRYDRRRKVGDDGTSWAPFSYSTDRLLLNRANVYLLEEEKIELWQKRCAEQFDRMAPVPRAAIENIACGDAVVDSQDEKMRIKELNRTCKAVEMEAGGFLEAIINQTVVGKALVIRGLSDYAAHKSVTDNDPDADWRSFAARNSSEFLVGFIRHFAPEHCEVVDRAVLTQGL